MVLSPLIGAAAPAAVLIFALFAARFGRRFGRPFRRSRLALPGSALVAGLCLAACASNGHSASTAGQPVQVTVAKGEYGFEVAYATAATAYLALSPSFPADRRAQAKALMLSLLDCDAAGRCTGYVQLARDAVAAGNAADVATQTAAISAVVAQVTSLINGTKQEPTR